MQGFEDLLDDAQFTNVQGVVRQLFLGMSKVLRLQANSLRRLEQRLIQTEDRREEIVKLSKEEAISSCISKEEGKHILYELETKVSKKDFEALVERVTKLETTQSDLSRRLDNVTATLSLTQSQLQAVSQAQKQPTPPPCLTCCPLTPTVENLLSRLTEVQAQIQDKENKTDSLEKFSQLQIKLNELKVESNHYVNKDEFYQLNYNKVDKSEIKDLKLEIESRPVRAEMITISQSHIRPALSAVASLEKSIDVIDSKVTTYLDDLTAKSKALEHSQDELKRLGIFALAQGGEGALALALGGVNGISTTSSTSYTSNIDGTESSAAPAIQLLQKHLQTLASNAAKDECKNCLNKYDLDISIANQTEYFMKQINIMAEAIRMETITSTREELLKTDRKVDTLNDGLRDLVERHAKTRRNLKDFSLNVSKSLSQKVDIKDFTTLIDRFESLDNIRDNIKSKGKQQQKWVEGSRNLFNSTSSNLKQRKQQAQSSSLQDDNNFLYEDESEFDFLLRNIKNQQIGSTTDEERETILHSNRKSSSPSSPNKKRSGSTSSSDISDNEISNIKKNIEILQSQLATIQSNTLKLTSKDDTNNNSNNNENNSDKFDWKIAMGDLALALRREISSKTSRDELSVILGEIKDRIEGRVTSLENNTSKKEEVAKIQTQLLDLSARVASELVGAKFLWTKGNPLGDGWIPWDTQIPLGGQSNTMNSSTAPPDLKNSTLSTNLSLPLAWEQGKATLRLRCPGLYRISFGVFTPIALSITVYVNEEPCLTLINSQSEASGMAYVNNSISNEPQIISTNQGVIMKRLKHSLGEVSCINFEQIFSLPSDARLAIRITPSSSAQAFLTIKKL